MLALLAAALYAVNIPFSKLLLERVQPVFMASLLYFGAGAGMALGGALHRETGEAPLTRRDLPYTAGMILLDIAAPICLMLGLESASPANVSLLGNFEIVATSLIARFAFREHISRRMWFSLALITAASALLSFEGAESLRFSRGSLFVAAACVCWGLENNCTRMLSDKSTRQIVLLKGVFSGLGSLIVALVSGESAPPLLYAVLALALGCVSYGLSIFFYVRAQRDLGAARTSAYYSVNPFIGSLLSLAVFGTALAKTYWLALAVMALGTVLASKDTLPQRS